MLAGLWPRRNDGSTVLVMRDGVPLPGTTPPVILSQLAYRIFGPATPGSSPDDARLPRARRTPRGQHVSRGRSAWNHHPDIENWSKTLTTAGSRVPLHPNLVAELARRTKPGEDHLARVRIATTLGVSHSAASPFSFGRRSLKSSHRPVSIRSRGRRDCHPSPRRRRPADHHHRSPRCCAQSPNQLPPADHNPAARQRSVLPAQRPMSGTYGARQKMSAHRTGTGLWSRRLAAASSPARR